MNQEKLDKVNEENIKLREKLQHNPVFNKQ